MNLDDENEDEDLDDIVDSEEDGSKQQDASDKLQDINDKANDIKDLVEKIKNNSNKSASPEGPTTKSSSKEASNNGSSSNNNAESQSGGNTSANSSNTSSGKSNSNGTNTGTSNSTGTGNSATGGMNTATGNGVNASGTAGASSGSTAAGETAASGAASSGATAGGTAAASGGAAAAGGTAAGGAAAGGAAAAATPVGWIILIIIAVIIILMMIIGFVSFFTNGIGLIGGKILEFADGIWTSLKSEFVGEAEATVKEKNIVEIGTYLENMGYDLEGFGFLDSNGKGTTKEDKLEDDGTGSGTKTGTRTIKNSDGKVILKRNITQSGNGEIQEGEITNISSECIWEYLVAENKTYIIKNVDRSLIEYFIPIWGNFVGVKDLVFGDYLNDGMIEIVEDGVFGETTSQGLFSQVKNVSINREKKEIIISLKHDLFSWAKDKYAYSLEGWTGKYGKPLEFLLTLHLATMAPDFAKEVARNKEFDALVKIKFKEVQASIRLITKDGTEITKDNYKELGYTEDEWKKIDEYNGEINTYSPYITQVENHWFYKNIDFNGAYEEITNPDYDKDNPQDNTGDFTYEYPYVGLGEDNDILADKGIYVREIRSSDMKQIREPKVTKREYKSGELSLQTMLLGGAPGSENTKEEYKYYIYDGSSMPEGTEREKRYIMQKVENGENTEYVMDTRFFQYAFAILESVHTQDAEFILRDLKELFSSLGVDISGIELSKDIGELKWIIPDFIPVNWDPMFNTTETEIKISAKQDNSNGFEKDLDVVMPADGKIVKVSEDDDGTKTLKIEFTGTDDSKLEGITIFIRGIESDVSVNDTYRRGDKIGKTYTKDIAVIMTDRNHTVITNVDNYLYPPEEN